MAEASGFNLFLIIVTVVAAFLIAAVVVYLLAAFSHPEDRMQAWFPKIVVCASMFIAIVSVLLFPLDVANRRACNKEILFSDCDLTLPMKEMWYTVYILNVILVYLVTPFTVFYYEADSELTLSQRLRSATMYTFFAILVFGLIFVIVYIVGGYVEYDTTLLSSAITPIQDLAAINGCVSSNAGTAAEACSALSDNVIMEVFQQRPSFLIFVIAVASILGWVLLMVMGGVGMVALPLDMIMAYFNRPQKTITKSQYTAEALKIALRAKDMTRRAAELRAEEKASGRSRQWRTRTRDLEKDMLLLEANERELEKQYPQGEDRDTAWVMYVLSFYFSFAFGVVFAIVAFTWLIHMVVYVIIRPPLHPFLNSFFEALDSVFVLFGTLAFALWCFFLILAAIKGFTKLGLNFGLIKLYPMNLGATMMSSFLVNSALILLASTAVVQFCAQAFEGYASETAIQEVFGNEIFSLRGVRHIFVNNIFVYIMLIFSLLTVVWILTCGRKTVRKKPLTLEEAYAQ